MCLQIQASRIQNHLPKYSYHRYLAIFHKSSSSRIRAAAEKAAVDSAAVDSAVAEKAAADLEVADLEAMAAVQAASKAAANSYHRRHNSPAAEKAATKADTCLLYTSPSPRDATLSRMPSSA